MRIFISINLDEAARKKISDIQNNIKEKISQIDSNFLNYIKWETEDKFHLTLFFLGEVNSNKVNILHSSLKKLETELSLGIINFTSKGINAFPKLRYPRVLILDLDNENKKVFELSNKLNSSLKKIGFENDKRFHPHITLGRIKREHKINLIDLENTTTINFNFSVQNFYLMESKLKSSGSEYSIIKEYKI